LKLKQAHVSGCRWGVRDAAFRDRILAARAVAGGGGLRLRCASRSARAVSGAVARARQDHGRRRHGQGSPGPTVTTPHVCSSRTRTRAASRISCATSPNIPRKVGQHDARLSGAASLLYDLTAEMAGITAAMLIVAGDEDDPTLASRRS
jgi:hypothetical protein